MPKISCLMAVNRYDQFVPAAIRSVLEQTYSDFEFIILTNGDPGIQEAIRSEFNDPRIHVTYSPIQQLGHNLNKGLELARGEYIARMDADDVSMPNRFSEQVSLLDQRPDLVLVSSRTFYIDEQGRDLAGPKRAPAWVNRRLWLKSAINHSAAMFRKREIMEVGGYAAGVAQDYELWLRLDRRHPGFFEIMDRCHLKFRNHAGQTRGRAEGFGASAGFLLREFVVRRDVRFLLGSFLMVVRGFLRGRRAA